MNNIKMKNFFTGIARWVTSRRTNVLVALVIAVGIVAAVSTFATGFSGTGRDCPKPVRDWVKIHGWYDTNTYNCAPNFTPGDVLSGNVVFPATAQYANPIVADPQFHTLNEFLTFIHSVQTPHPVYGALNLVLSAYRQLPADQFQAWYAGTNFIPVGFNNGIPEGYTQFINGHVTFLSPDEIPAGWHRQTERDTYLVFVWKGQVNENGNVRFFCGNSRVTGIRPVVPQTPPTPETGTLKLHKFEDINGNGVQDAGEPPLANVTLNITGPDYTNTVHTDANGNVVLPHLVPGSYTVTQQVPAGYKVTTANPQTGSVVATHTTVLNFGDQKIPPTPGNLKLHKFKDLNGNGVQDQGEPDFGGVTLTTSGPNNFTNTSQTDSAGNVTLNSLTPGDYTATQQVPGGYAITTANPQTGAVVSSQTTVLNFGDQLNAPTPTPVTSPSPTPETSPTPPVIVSPSPVPTPVPSPTPCQQPGVLNLHTFIDSNKSGVQESDEPGLADTTFTITASNGTKTISNKTDANGNVAVELPHDTFKVVQNPRDGYATTQSSQTVTMVNCQTQALTFVNRLSPEPSPLPSGVPSPVPTVQPLASPVPPAPPGTRISPTPPPGEPVGKGLVKAFTDLPQTGQSLLIVLLTILLAAGIYFGERYIVRRFRQPKK